MPYSNGYFRYPRLCSPWKQFVSPKDLKTTQKYQKHPVSIASIKNNTANMICPKNQALYHKSLSLNIIIMI